MNLDLSALDGLVIAISALFGASIRLLVDRLWKRGAWPTIWIGGALLCTLYGFIITCAQMWATSDQMRWLMYLSFIVTYIASVRKLPQEMFDEDPRVAFARFLGGVIFALLYVWIGTRIAHAVYPYSMQTLPVAP